MDAENDQAKRPEEDDEAIMQAPRDESADHGDLLRWLSGGVSPSRPSWPGHSGCQAARLEPHWSYDHRRARDRDNPKTWFDPRVEVPGFPQSKTLNGAEGDRTLNLRIANAALSQLSYRPNRITGIKLPFRTPLRKVRWTSARLAPSTNGDSPGPLTLPGLRGLS